MDARTTVRKAARRTLTALPEDARVARLGETAVSVPLILRSGIFDREWYETQARRSFSGIRAACTHYVTTGRRAGLSPHPLFEPEYWDNVRWQQRLVDPVVRYTRRPGDSPAPIFDVAHYLQQHPGAGQHRFGPLAHFLASATPASVLPTPELGGVRPQVSWGAARAVMLARARVFAAQENLRLDSRITDTYDRAEERRLLRRAGSLPLPAPAPGLPLVSIITPVKDRPEQIVAAIRSVQAQSMDSWELIVVDDGSVDNTADVVAALAEADPRIVLLRRENAGVCAARNAGADRARGTYVAWLDSDNTWLPHFLRTMVTTMASAGHRAAYAGMAMQTADAMRYRTFDGGREHLLLGNHIDLNVLLVTRELLDGVGGFDQELKRTVDYDLVLRLTEHSPITYLPFLGAAYHHDSSDETRITTTQPATWREVVMNKHLIDWRGLAAGLDQRVPGRVSVLMPTYQDWVKTQQALLTILGDAGPVEDRSVEVVILDNGSRRAVSAILASYAAMDPRVRIARAPINLNFALGSNLALAESTGEFVVFLNNDTEVQPGWLIPIRDALADPDVLGVAPLLLYPDGTVQSAGQVFGEHSVFPAHFLADHPADDARRLGSYPVAAVSGAALALRAADAIALRGFDPLYGYGLEDTDLCLRLARQRSAAGSATGSAAESRSGSGPAAFRVVTESVVLHAKPKVPGRKGKVGTDRGIFAERWRDSRPRHDEGLWERAGFVVAHHVPETTPHQPRALQFLRPLVVRPRRQAPPELAFNTPSLRWAIKTDGPLSERPAYELGDALARLGQDFVVDPQASHVRATGYLDDVVLVLRGAVRVAPQPGRVNLIWVLGHPNELRVSAEELAGFDAVFAVDATSLASRTSWEGAGSGVDVAPLPVAVDAAARELLDSVLGLWKS